MISCACPGSASCRAAGIDLGSNTFRLLVADVSGSRLTVLAKELASVRLGEKVGATGMLAPAAMERGFAVLRAFRPLLEKFRPESLRVCGTAALRIAANREQFCRQGREILAAPIEVISGEEEAGLTLAGALTFLKHPLASPGLLVDVGGGSTELVLAEGHAGGQSGWPENPRLASLPLGAVGLTEELLGQGIAGADELARLSGRIREVLSPALKTLLAAINPGRLQVLATGGTATALAAMDLGLTSYDATLVHGHLLSNVSLTRLRDRLAGMAARDRNRLPGLDHGRGEIILAGLDIYRGLLALLGLDGLLVSDTGLLEGILLSSLENL